MSDQEMSEAGKSVDASQAKEHFPPHPATLPASEASHTPGPWSIHEYGDEDLPALVIHKDSETRVCFMATPGSHGDPARIEADARLIAAAPTMLATLDEIASLMHGLPRGKTADHVERICREAIAKATGATP